MTSVFKINVIRAFQIGRRCTRELKNKTYGGKKKVLKYWSAARARLCRRNPGLNQGPLDLQSNALPTELFRPSKESHFYKV